MMARWTLALAASAAALLVVQRVEAAELECDPDELLAEWNAPEIGACDDVDLAAPGVVEAFSEASDGLGVPRYPLPAPRLVSAPPGKRSLHHMPRRLQQAQNGRQGGTPPPRESTRDPVVLTDFVVPEPETSSTSRTTRDSIERPGHPRRVDRPPRS